MTFPTNTIKLGASQVIFQGADIAAHDSQGNRIPEGEKTRVTYYSAKHPTEGERIVDAGLTSLCTRLWSLATGANSAQPEQND